MTVDPVTLHFESSMKNTKNVNKQQHEMSAHEECKDEFAYESGHENAQNDANFEHMAGSSSITVSTHSGEHVRSTHSYPGPSFHFKLVTVLLVPLVCCCLLCCIFCAQSRDWIRGFLGLQYVYRESYPSPNTNPTSGLSETLVDRTGKLSEITPPPPPSTEVAIGRQSSVYGSLDHPRSDVFILDIKDPT